MNHDSGVKNLATNFRLTFFCEEAQVRSPYYRIHVFPFNIPVSFFSVSLRQLYRITCVVKIYSLKARNFFEFATPKLTLPHPFDVAKCIKTCYEPSN